MAELGSKWAIATPEASATQAGEAAFRAGGNAIDAALAAATTLAVTYPHNCGVGGDLIALVRRPSGEVVCVNSTGRSPAATDVSAALTASRGPGEMPERGPLTVTTPGAAAGWEAIHRQGAALPWGDAFTSAIQLARDGCPTTATMARALEQEQKTLEANSGFAQVFFPGGQPLLAGEFFRQPALAITLQTLAASGSGVLYSGDLAERFVQGMNQAGCPISMDDLTLHDVVLDSPLIGSFAGLDVLVPPPNSQGFVLLEILAALERMEVELDPFGADAGVIAHAMRVACEDRDEHLADPEYMRISAMTLLDDGHIAAVCDLVRSAVAGGHTVAAEVSEPQPQPRGDTAVLMTADAQGWCVSLVQSLYESFGSGILEPSTGIVAHNRGACFNLIDGHPNALEPGKRPAHTLMPVIALRDGKPAIVAGTRGGHFQPQINALNLMRLAALGQRPAEALAEPRWLAQDVETVLAETSVPSTALSSLEGAGFSVRRTFDLDEETGHAQIITIEGEGKRSTFQAASDPRADGSAAVE